MAFWEGEIRELGTLYDSFKGHLPDIVKELEQLIKTDDPNVVMLYSRRCLEVIVTDLCETELKRPRKTEPLKGIIDKLNSEEKVPSHIITSMLSLNSMANYGAHPKDFDPEQVKPVLNNLAIIIKWYLKYKDFKIVSKAGTEEKVREFIEQPAGKKDKTEHKPKKDKFLNPFRKFLLVILVIILAVIFLPGLIYKIKNRDLNKPIIIQMDPDKLAFNDPVNNQIYSEIKMGNQIWMGQNLRAEKFNDGTPIPYLKDPVKWDGTRSPAYCWYDNNKSLYKPSYGALYNWYAVSTGKLCPEGWHVPTAAEWDTLALFLDPYATRSDSGYYYSQEAGMKLKADGNLFWQMTDSIRGSNYNGFMALPGGYRSSAGFYDMGSGTGWWSSTAVKDPPDYAFERNIREVLNSMLDRGPDPKNVGFSVRCLKDQKPE
ncbi:MAG: fibrobacter succinogenes major paralogous domain-containing protein [Bacteroidia bacterium]|nr:fibrobacter succinogenes major paralogous domain-containing protein [Bacteroidia bacterium]